MKWKRKISFIAMTSVILFSMQNCGEYSALQDESYSGNFSLSSDASSEAQRLPFQMLTKKQILSSLVTSGGLIEADTNLKTTNSKYRSVLSESPDLFQYNSPRGMTYANLAGATCQQIILQEKAEKNNRLIRHGLPISIKDVSQQSIDETIRSFARSFWSRNETTQEYKVITEGLEGHLREIASLNEQAQTERQVLFLCTAMLSALDAITY